LPRRKRRLDPAAFHLPVELIRQGFYSDRSAVQARDTLVADGAAPRVLLQASAEQGGVLGGADEAIAILKLCADDWGALTVHALYDGDRVEPWETVLTIEGPYTHFAHLEPLLVGVLSRRTRVSTNARQLSEEARPKPVLMLPSERDVGLAYPWDAAAAQIGGAIGLAYAVPPLGRGQPALAIVPHNLIAAYGGDTVRAACAFASRSAPDLQLLAPVDFENDAVRTAVEVARALDGRLWGVHLVTSPYLVDRSILAQMGEFVPSGVSPQLVWNVRNGLDAEGMGDIRIVLSGDVRRALIRQYEEDGVPVDAYGVSGALLEGAFAFTADVVQVDDAPRARAGRRARPNPRMARRIAPRVRLGRLASV
jgi:nicotinate phosphoribosyltransferase